MKKSVLASLLVLFSAALFWQTPSLAGHLTPNENPSDDGSVTADDMTGLTAEEREAQLAAANSEEMKECRRISDRFAKPLIDREKNPETLSDEACKRRKAKAVEELNQQADALIAKINSGDSVKESCDALTELYEDTESQMNRAVVKNDHDETDDEESKPDKSCQYRFKQCNEELREFQQRFQEELEIGKPTNKAVCGEVKSVNEAIKVRARNCSSRLNHEAEQLKTDLQKVQAAKAIPTKCASAGCAGEDCEKKKGGKAAGAGGGGGKDAGKKDDKKAGGGSGMPQGMPQSQASQPQQPDPPKVQELAADSCYKYENQSKPSCQCMLTGNCRNPDGTAVAQLGTPPGTGGAKLIQPTSTASLGSSGPQMPAMRNAEGGGGGGGMMAAGAGGGGGPGGGGPQKPDAAKPKPRSALAADILQGVRGGAGSKGGGRTHPGFGVPAFEGSRSAGNVDVSKFVPDSRMPAALSAAIPVDVSGMGSGPAHLHPSSANIFHEVTRQYHQQQTTLDSDK